ncbi:MAG: 3-hydroxyacyl-CoA dehydrogenase family protein [Solirubrobacterales bacterium]
MWRWARGREGCGVVSQSGGTTRKVLVVGGGEMGTGITQLLLAVGHSVHLVDSSAAALKEALATLRRRLDREIGLGRMEGSTEVLLSRLTIASCSGEQCVADDVTLAIEAVPNVFGVKRDVLRRLLDTSDAVTVVATTSLAMPVSMLVDVKRPTGRVLGYHFMNPAPALRLCELVVPSGATDAAVEWSREFLCGLGVKVIEVDDRPGFGLNRTHVPFLLGAIERVEEGMSPDDVDSLFVIGCRHPMGPLATVDLVGLDVLLGIADVLLEADGARFEAPKLLRELVAAGNLGRKSGRGFFVHSGVDIG